MAQDHTQLIASTAIVVVANEKHTVVVCPQSHAVLEEAAETICCLVNAVSMCQSTFNFDDFLLLSDIIILVGKERWIVYKLPDPNYLCPKCQTCTSTCTCTPDLNWMSLIKLQHKSRFWSRGNRLCGLIANCQSREVITQKSKHNIMCWAVLKATIR